MGMKKIVELRILIEGIVEEDKGLRADIHSLSLDNTLLVQFHNRIVDSINSKYIWDKLSIMAQYVMDHYEQFESYDIDMVMARADDIIEALKKEDSKQYDKYNKFDPILIAGQLRAGIRVLEGERIIFNDNMHQYSIYIDKDYDKLESTRKKLEEISKSYPYCTFSLQTLTNDGMDVMEIQDGETRFGNVDHNVFKGDYKLTDINVKKLTEEGWLR